MKTIKKYIKNKFLNLIINIALLFIICSRKTLKIHQYLEKKGQI